MASTAVVIYHRPSPALPELLRERGYNLCVPFVHGQVTVLFRVGVMVVELAGPTNTTTFKST